MRYRHNPDLQLVALREQLQDLTRERNRREDYLDNLQISRVHESRIDKEREDIRKLEDQMRTLAQQIQVEVDKIDAEAVRLSAEEKKKVEVDDAYQRAYEAAQHGPAQLSLFRAKSNPGRSVSMAAKSHKQNPHPDSLFDRSPRRAGYVDYKRERRPRRGYADQLADWSGSETELSLPIGLNEFHGYVMGEVDQFNKDTHMDRQAIVKPNPRKKASKKASQDYFRMTRDQLVRSGTAGAIAELRRRGRDAEGNRAGTKAGTKKRRAVTKGRKARKSRSRSKK